MIRGNSVQGQIDQVRRQECEHAEREKKDKDEEIRELKEKLTSSETKSILCGRNSTKSNRRWSAAGPARSRQFDERLNIVDPRRVNERSETPSLSRSL